MKNSARFIPGKRTALDGKVWWVVLDRKERKYSTYRCFGRYVLKRDAQAAIDYYVKAWSLEGSIA